MVPDSWTASRIALGVLVALLSTLASSALVVAFVVRISPGYFLSSGAAPVRAFGSPVGRVVYVVGKNVLGLALLGVGFVLALPGVPGQGLLTMLMGVMLLDVPGKRRFELAFVRRAPVLKALNRIRARFDQAPLVVERE